MYYNHEIQSILTDWKSEAKISHLMLYRLRNHELTIYTDKPGPLIGLRGERIARYEAKLKAVPLYSVDSVRIEETTGIF